MPTETPSLAVYVRHARVLIIEDQRLVADFFHQHCKSLEMEVLGISETLTEGLAMVQAHRPELLLLDFSLPDGDGLEAGRKLRQEMPALKIIGISAHRDPWTMLKVQRAGLQGFVDKNQQEARILTNAIETVMSGQIYYTPIVATATAQIRRDPNAFMRVLSDYELQLLALIGRSLTDQEIAEQLGISPSTMQSRRRDIMQKLDIHSTPKLIHFAIVSGITRPDHLR